MSPKWRTIFCMGDIERIIFLFLFFNLRIRIVLFFHWYGLYYRDTFFQRISINKGTSIMTDHIISNGNDRERNPRKSGVVTGYMITHGFRAESTITMVKTALNGIENTSPTIPTATITPSEILSIMGDG